MMQINKPSIKFEESNNSAVAKFTIEPLERGFGTTIGNAMRRVLLGGLPGAAPMAIRIQGVQHEFSVVPGVDLDVADIILNIKSLIVRTQITDPAFRANLSLKVKGPRVVTAGDIVTPEGVDIMNPDLVLCTVSAGATFDMEMVVGRGRGYVLAKDNKDACDSFGFIAVDSIFSPVKAVEYHVESARVGQNINFDKLTMEVTTNGATSAKEVTSLAAKVLNDHLSLFIELVENMADQSFLVAKEEDDQKKILDLSINELELSVRSTNCLKRANINNVGDLTSKTHKELAKVRNLGNKSLEEIIQKIEDLGLKLKEEED